MELSKIITSISNGIDFRDILLIILIGGLLNTFAVARNDGMMPVYTDINCSGWDDTHFCTTNKSEIREFKLVDRFNFFGSIFSFGDLFICLGFVMICFKCMPMIIVIKKECNKIFRRRRKWS